VQHFVVLRKQDACAGLIGVYDDKGVITECHAAY
jgi:hypothetical protein